MKNTKIDKNKIIKKDVELLIKKPILLLKTQLVILKMK